MAEILSIISIVAFVLSALFLVLAIVLWFLYGIPGVIGDLSGRTARKSIAKMREHNEKSGGKSYRPSATNIGRGRLTDTMPNSDELKVRKANEQPKDGFAGTDILTSNKAETYNSDQTVPLEGDSVTALLIDENETALLAGTTPRIPKRTGGVKLTMIEDIILIHTEEVIG